MGYYLNGKEEKYHFVSKLISEEKARRVTQNLLEAFKTKKENETMCCLVDNGAFEALGIIYSEAELQAFSQPTDRRGKVFFIAKDTDLRQYDQRGFDAAPKGR